MECECSSLRGLFQVQGWLRTQGGGSGHPFPGRWVDGGGDDDATRSSGKTGIFWVQLWPLMGPRGL